MSGLAAFYARKMEAHPEFIYYAKERALNREHLKSPIILADMLRHQSHRGYGTIKIAIGGREITESYESFHPDSAGIYDMRSKKGAGMVTKRGVDDFQRIRSGAFIDGYFRNMGDLAGTEPGVFASFEGSLRGFLRNGNLREAAKFVNRYLNGSVVMNTDDGIMGARSATGYKQLFLMHMTDDRNDIVSLVSEDCVKEPYMNRDPTKRPSEFQGMSVESELLDEGEIVVVADGEVIRESSSVELGTGRWVGPQYDPHEPVYGLSLNSTWNGEPVLDIRMRIGADLSELHRDMFRRLDLVSYVPDEPAPIARGFNSVSRVQYDEVMQKDRYNKKYQQRNYRYLTGKDRDMEPADSYQSMMLMSEKLVSGKQVVVIDDSTIRGNHLRNVSRMLAGRSDGFFVNAEVPVVNPKQVGIYSQDVKRELVTRTEMDRARADGRRMESMSDLNDVMSEWAGMRVLFNTPCNLSKSLRTEMASLYFPDRIRHLN